MGNRLSKIYTRTGDDGTTGMADGSRVSKGSLLFDAMGDIDELNAHIGMARALLNADHTLPTRDADSLLIKYDQTLSIIQHLLFNIGGELALSNSADSAKYKSITQTHLSWLEAQIDTINAKLSSLKDFILPAGSTLCAQVHIARTICRRAERQLVKLDLHSPDSVNLLTRKFINRLSDWLFVFSREVMRMANSDEVLWQQDILETLKT